MFTLAYVACVVYARICSIFVYARICSICFKQVVRGHANNMAPRLTRAAAGKPSVVDLLQEKEYKLPKAVAAARSKCGGVENVTPETLKAIMSKTELNNLANNFRLGMSAAVKDEYARLSTDAERRQWLCQYVVDPEVATKTGYNSTEAVNDVIKEGTEQWLHLSEIGGPLHLNDMAAAQAIVSSGVLQERPSEWEILAGQGMKQYWFSKELVRRSTGTKERAGVRVQSELKDSEYKEVQQHIATSMGKSSARKRPATPKEPESAATK